MNQGVKWIKEHHNIIIGIAIAIITIGLGIGLWAANRETISMPQDSVIVDVNSELDQEISKYVVGMKQPERAVANWDVVDMGKVGIYDVTITYKESDFVLHVDVRDRIAPTLQAEQSEFAFTLDTPLEEVNRTIDGAIVISDNYDREFAAISAVKELPKEAQEITYPIQVKDSSGNESEPLTIKVTFKEASREEAEGMISIPQGNTSQGNTSPNIPPAENPPQEDHQESTPPAQADKPVAPAGAIEGTFATEQEAIAWLEMTSDPESEWYTAIGFMRKLPDGTWWAYIQKP